MRHIEGGTRAVEVAHEPLLLVARQIPKIRRAVQETLIEKLRPHQLHTAQAPALWVVHVHELVAPKHVEVARGPIVREH